MAEQINSRALALEILMEVNEKGKYSHQMIREVLEKYQYLEKRERAFLTRLVEGTLERQIELDYRIDQLSKIKVKKMKPLIRNLMRMSAYQICYSVVPDSAVCNEAVKLAKKRGFSQLAGFVNGVLRNLSREWKEMKLPTLQEEPIKALSIRYSMPEWIVGQWKEEFGMEKLSEMLEQFFKEKPMTIRTNLTKCTPQQLCERLQQEGVTVGRVEGLSYAFTIKDFDYLYALDSFVDGWFYVQDVSSMYVAEYAAPQKGIYVIDVCAAPGGKSTHIAELLGGTGMVEARDLTEYKVGLIEENIERHGLSNIRAVQMDATVVDQDSIDRADILLCDLPCSGLGVLGKKTDIKYKMTPQKQAELVELQREIFSNVRQYVRPGGTIIYSTCTIHQEENEKNVRWFVEHLPDLAIVEMKQFLPGEPCSDGFFIAKLVDTRK